jgi:hypothetical protein
MSFETVFTFAVERHRRRHNPIGYVDYQSYKPWLRDEFCFRCVYCLWRETWCADGDGSFGVDHFHPRTTHPDEVNEYPNLFYVCCRCNSLKQDCPLPVSPCAEGWGNHLQFVGDGTIRGLTIEGEQTIEVCRLNRPMLVDARRRMMRLLNHLANMGTKDSSAMLRDYLGFPVNLPALSRLHPPGGNTLAEGIRESYYEKSRRGELLETY